jgi:hypothetical protein
MMLSEFRSERDLVVLYDDDERDALLRRQVHAFVELAGLCRAVANPRHSDAPLAGELEGQGYARHYGNHCADVADGSDDVVRDVANVEVAACVRRVRGREVTAQHVGNRHALLVAGARVADHRRYDVVGFECVDAADRGGFFAGAEPRFRDHAGLHPAFQCNVVKAVSDEAGVEREELLDGQRGDDGLSVGDSANRFGVRGDVNGIGRPVEVLGRVEGGKAFHRSAEYSSEAAQSGQRRPPRFLSRER